MDKDLLQPTATIVAALIAAKGVDVDIKAEFIHTYQLLLDAKKELTPPRKGAVRPLSGLI